MFRAYDAIEANLSCIILSTDTVIVGWRKKEGEEDVWEGDSIDLYEFIKTGKEVEFDEFTDDVLDNLTYKYPSTRWEKGLGDDCE